MAKHVASLGAKKTATVWQREVADYGDDYADDDQYESETDEVVSSASQALSPSSQEERNLLKKLSDFAAKSSRRPDSKTQKLIDWLGQNLKPKGSWNTERVIIFTEYRATQKWLYDLLARHGFGEEGRLERIYGGMPSDQRERVKAAFQASPADAAVRILLATDAASEGVNLQNYCSKLIHFEIPWNPNRMEQRNGRVDHHGQKADEVQIFHFVGKGFGSAEMVGKVGDLEADLEFLMRAALKVETIREDLGKVGPVIAWQVEEAMLGKRTQLDTARAEQEAEPVRRILKFERKLREQMEKLAAQLDETKRDLILNVRRLSIATSEDFGN